VPVAKEVGMGNPAEKNDCALDRYIIVHRREQDKASSPPLIPDERLSTSTDCNLY
jgi:hypothetical protein